MPILTAVHGDLTAQQVDAVVNAANNRMRGGGGVDGALHRAGGTEVLADCIARFPHGLATGDAGWTTGGALPARWIIHTVGPNHAAGERDRELLVSCYRRALEVADELGARSVAAPLVSAGVYGWPLDDAIDAAVDTLAHASTDVVDIRLVARDASTFRRLRARVLRSSRRPAAPGSVGSLFDRGVFQLGLRGDAYLWLELQDRFADTPLPASALALRDLLTRAVEEAAGAPLTSDTPSVYVPEFDPGHGMSAGQVSLEWWRRSGIPILVDRFGAATGRD